MKVEVGKTYINGWNHEVVIIRKIEKPTAGTFEYLGLTDNGHGYHTPHTFNERGICAENADEKRYNLVSEIDTFVVRKPNNEFVKMRGSLEVLKVHYGEVYAKV